MLNREVVDALPPVIRQVAVKGLIELGDSGVIQAQIRHEEQQLLQGNAWATQEEMAQELRNFRVRRGLLLELEQLAQYYRKQIDA